jgi:hypothetical protein
MKIEKLENLFIEYNKKNVFEKCRLYFLSDDFIKNWIRML